VLGFKPVVADTIRIEEGGHLRHIFFDVGGGPVIAFLEPNGIVGLPAPHDAGITGGLGLPTGFHHFAFEAGSTTALAQKRDELRDKGVNTTNIVDHGPSRSDRPSTGGTFATAQVRAAAPPRPSSTVSDPDLAALAAATAPHRSSAEPSPPTPPEIPG
jgi:Glyoxalase/Bleomycin resistance protein/Dioxygenase superfamily